MPGEGSLPRTDAIVVTATRSERPRYEVPTALTLVTSDLQSSAPAPTLPERLRGQPGIYIQQTTPGQATPIIRGQVGSSILMLVDGMRLNSAFFRPAPNQYFALVDAENIDQIEVVRGTASTLYGSDAMGGVIQVLTHTPYFEGPHWQLHGRLRGAFSSADTSWLARASLEAGNQDHAVAGGATYQAHGDLRAGGEGGVQRPSSYSLYAFDGKASIQRGHHALTLSTQYLREPSTPRYDELVPGYGQTEPSSSTFQFEPNDRLFVHGRYRLDQPVAFINRLELDAAFQRIHDDRRTRSYGSTEERSEQNRSDLAGITLKLLSPATRTLVLTYGLDYYHDLIRSGRSGYDAETGETVDLESRYPDGSSMDSAGLYLYGELEPGSRFSASAGARFSYFRVHIPQADREIGTDLEVPDLTANASLRYTAAPGIHLVTNAGRGFRVPNVFDLASLGPRPGGRYQVPNPDLRPESNLSIDAGIKVNRHRLRGEAFGFLMQYRDKIEAVPTGEVTEDGLEVVQSMNLSRVTLVGTEAGLELDLLEALLAFGSLTYTWAEETFPSGETAPGDRIPPLNGRAGIRHHPRTRWWWEGSVRFAARQDRLSNRDLEDPRIDPAGTAGWYTLNLRGGVTLLRHLEAYVALENLTDQRYREHGSGIDAPGFNATVSVTASF